jgi:hypothetical protein
VGKEVPKSGKKIHRRENGMMEFWNIGIVVKTRIQKTEGRIRKRKDEIVESWGNQKYTRLGPFDELRVSARQGKKA